MAVLKIAATLMLYLSTSDLVTVIAQAPVITGPEDDVIDEDGHVFLTCQVQYLNRDTHVVSWLLGSTIISDDGVLRIEELDNLIGDEVSERYKVTVNVIPPEPRIYDFEMFIMPAKGADNGMDFKCAVCPKISTSDPRCNGNLEYESQTANLEVKYRPDTSLYPKCISQSSSETETIVILGQPTILTCESEIANPPVNLQWRKGSQTVAGTMSPDTAGMRRLDHELTPVISDTGAIFSCTVSSDHFDDLTDTACSLPPVKVASIPNVAIDSPGEVKVGSRANFVCTASSPTNAALEEFDWNVDLPSNRYEVSKSGSESTLTIKRTEGSDHGIIVTCLVTDSDNQVGERDAMILIAGKHPPTGGVTPPTDTTGTPGPSNTSLIAGTVVAGVVLLVLIIAFTFWFCNRRKSSKTWL